MQQHPSGAHLITWIVPQSVAYACDKLVLGDEILQVNYITVVRPSPSRSPNRTTRLRSLIYCALHTSRVFLMPT